MADRYLRIILTVIAIELGWLALKGSGTPVMAQQAAEPTRVVIAGIEHGPMPVHVVDVVPVHAVDTTAVHVVDTVKVETIHPVKVEADKPLPVENIRYTPSPRPGE